MSIQNEDSYVRFRDLALPITVVNELTEKAEAELTARRQAWQEEQERKAATADTEQRKKETGKTDGATIKTAYCWPDPLVDHPGQKLKIFNKEEVEKYLDSAEVQGKDFDNRKRLAGLLKTLETSGEYRKLAELPENWRDDLTRMAARFPNFGEVIDYVKVCCALAEKKDRVLAIRLLLSGPPGTGKSMFSQVLAEWIGGGYSCVRYESAQSGSELGGSSDFWSNTKAGKLFTMLTEGEYGNPTFFLDEIDKVTADRYDPLGPLYALLEPGTARQHIDLSWPFLKLDCSRVNYVAACNSDSGIPEPILSRLRRFHIEAPTAEQAFKIAHNIFTEEVQQADPKILVPEEVIKAICELSPRRMRSVAQEAIGRALYHGRSVLQTDDVVMDSAKTRRSIGFLN